MIVGSTDLLAVPDDYKRLKAKLEELGSLHSFKETIHGHLGVISPCDDKNQHIDYLLNDVLKKEVIGL